MKKTRSEKITEYVFLIALGIYTLLVWYLIYNQLLFPTTGRFEADTPVHVKMAVEDGFVYSLTSIIYVILCKLPLANYTISFVLALMSSLSVYYTSKLIITAFALWDTPIKRPLVYIISFASNFVMGFYVNIINKQHYIGYQNANMWHNSTYIAMKLFAIITLINFLVLCESYKNGMCIKAWITFTLSLAITTCCKPSFFVVFAPVMAIMLLVDWIRKTKFIRVFVFGATVFLSIIIMIWESVVLFGSDTGNGYVIAPFAELSRRGDHPKATLILSVAFPLMVLAMHFKNFYKDKLYFGSILIWLVGFCESFFLAETGSREGDGNFLWGYSIALFIWFLASILKLVKDIWEKEFRHFSGFKKAYVILCLLVFGWHVISGLWYFGLLLTGVTYFV